jgi:hypothetical protein
MSGMFVKRQQRVRVLEELERRAKAFRTDEDLYPLRVPREPLPLTEVIEQALPEQHSAFDPLSLRQRTLLHLTWDDGSTWELWATVLPSGLKLFCDSGEEEARVLASGGRHASDDTDRQFLELFSESAGSRFGIEMEGGAPSRVRTSLTDREFLTDLFVNLFEVAGAEESVRRALAQEHGHASDDSDFRADVKIWLSHALQ